ncbi:MAG: energy-coupling factor transporter transmembrane protein EcfT, partial [Clostridia bacterium]|nr:energy-coupling factor transporter transmembrane protein EcfT [Clostridia bacterium]
MTYADRLHPLTVFAFYCAILVLTMTATHPVALLSLFVSAVLLRAVQIGVKRTLAGVPIALLLLLSVTAINLFLVHRGAKILFFLNGKPITLEAGLAGVFSGLMIL